jgi:phage shock protein C
VGPSPRSRNPASNPTNCANGPKGFGRHASRPGGRVEAGKGADHGGAHVLGGVHAIGVLLFLLMTSTSWWCVLSPRIAVPASTFRALWNRRSGAIAFGSGTPHRLANREGGGDLGHALEWDRHTTVPPTSARTYSSRRIEAYTSPNDLGGARMPTAQLTRSETDKKIGGVAGGMAAYFGVDPTLVRVLWLIAGLMGWGIVAYVIFWIVLPKGPGSTPAMRVAEERFARGEITVEDLHRIRSDLEGHP